MSARDVACDGEAEAGAAGFPIARFLDPVKRSKDVLPLGLWNAGPVIVDGDFDIVSPPAGAYPNMISVFRRIGDEIINASPECLPF